MKYYPNSHIQLILPPNETCIKQAFGFSFLADEVRWYQQRQGQLVALEEAQAYQQGRTPSRTFMNTLYVLFEHEPLGYVFCRHSAEHWEKQAPSRTICSFRRCHADDPLWTKRIKRELACRPYRQHQGAQMLIQRGVGWEREATRTQQRTLRFLTSDVVTR